MTSVTLNASPAKSAGLQGLSPVPYPQTPKQTFAWGAFPSRDLVSLAASLLVSAPADSSSALGLVAAEGRPDPLQYGTDPDYTARRSGVVWRGSVASSQRGVRRQPYTLAVSGGSIGVERSAKGGDGGRLGGDRVAGDIRGWSKRSRSRMRRALAELDYAPLVDATRISSRPPVMVTLTLPGDWLAVAPDGPTFKRLFRRFEDRWSRAFGRPLWIWKMEFQTRGAPHIHLLTPPPAVVPFFRCAVCSLRGLESVENGCPGGRAWCSRFTHWVSTQWSESVAAKGSDRPKHVVAGTGVDRDRRNSGDKMVDPRRLATYFLKHGSGGAKEYQHEAPAEWLSDRPVVLTEAEPVQDLDGFHEDERVTGLGRFWGYLGYERATALVPVTRSEYHYVRRTLRRLGRSKARSRVVVRAAPGVGEYNMVVGCRQAYWTPSGSGENRESGLWVAFNDAPSVLSGLVGVMRSRPPVVSPLRGVRTARVLLGGMAVA